MDKRSIEIDIDIHKAIELARKSFSETDNQVLRRLLMIDAVSEVSQAKEAKGRPWIGKGSSTGLTLPHGTKLLLQYNTTNMEGEITDGAIVFDGKSFSSPSGAATKLCRTKDGKKTNLNGKNVIQAKLPSIEHWVYLVVLQEQMKLSAKYKVA